MLDANASQDAQPPDRAFVLDETRVHVLIVVEQRGRAVAGRIGGVVEVAQRVLIEAVADLIMTIVEGVGTAALQPGQALPRPRIGEAVHLRELVAETKLAADFQLVIVQQVQRR